MSQSISGHGADFKDPSVLQLWEGMGAESTQTRWVVGKQPTLAGPGLGHYSEPSCSPGAAPLLLSASSRSLHPQLTVCPGQFDPQVQATYLFSQVLLFDPIWWSSSQKGSKAFKPSSGLSPEKSQSGLFAGPKYQASVCSSSPGGHPSLICPKSACAKVCGHDDIRWDTKELLLN